MPPPRLVFDSTGRTQKAWGVQTYPMTFLVDPQGRLVGPAKIEDLAQKLNVS